MTSIAPVKLRSPHFGVYNSKASVPMQIVGQRGLPEKPPSLRLGQVLSAVAVSLLIVTGLVSSCQALKKYGNVAPVRIVNQRMSFDGKPIDTIYSRQDFDGNANPNRVWDIYRKNGEFYLLERDTKDANYQRIARLDQSVNPQATGMSGQLALESKLGKRFEFDLSAGKLTVTNTQGIQLYQTYADIEAKK